jgi:tetratricopeptide (TPR) repeat protein
VITSDGVAHTLDPKTIAEEPVQEEEPNVYRDQKLMRAPLPGAAAGVVVEAEIRTPESSPEFDRGVVRHFNFGHSVPVRETRLSIEAPSSLPLHYVTRLLPAVTVQKSEDQGLTKIVFQNGPLAAIKSIEPLMPGDVPRVPHVAVSTGSTWQDVAAHYSALVDDQIRSADLKTLVPTQNGTKERAAIIAGLVARLHAEVRYTGVEFGEASLVPRTPAETLKRKYGDCKDKAALLIAMLRASGIRAYMALLNTFPGEDAASELPGLGNFEHAIVYVPGPPDLWIDATDEFARVGSLNPEDQGRLSLIVRPETTGLARTPESESAANRELETREVFLAELGPSRVVETTEATGSIEEGYREEYRAPESDNLRQSLVDYAQAIYAASLSRYEYTKAQDTSTPFKLRLEMDHATRGVTSRVDAVVAISTAAMFIRLPEMAREEAGASAKRVSSAASSEAQVDSRRNADLELPEPYVEEWHYRIVPPPGFRTQALPASGKEQMGPAVLAKEFTLEPDGTVTANLRFDTVKRRFTSGEFEQLREGVVKSMQAEPILVKFEQIGEAYLAAGNVREALAEFNKLAALHPQEGLHHAQVASALLAGGMGEAARAEARRAIQLDPKSATAYETLAFILEHDLIGRQFEKGFDLAGAEAAYRKAIELDPTDKLAAANLAIVLEFNSKGQRYGPGARLDQAIGQYQSLGEGLGQVGLEDNLLFALMWAQRFKALKESAQKLPATPTRRALWLLAIAATDGAEAAKKQAAQDLPEEARREVEQAAAYNLMKLRTYGPAADLLAASAEGAQDAASLLSRADMIRRVRRHEDLTLPDGDPSSVVKKFFLAALSDNFNEQDILGLMSRQGAKEVRKEGFKDARTEMRAVRQRLTKAGLELDEAIDFELSLMQLAVDGGDDAGYRLRILGPNSESDLMTCYVVKEDGQYRILSVSSDTAALGYEVIERAEKGDLAGARRLLDFLREETTPAGGDDRFAGPAFPHFWTKGQQGDRETIRIAGATLIAAAGDDRAVSILLEGRDKAASEEERRQFDEALAQAYMGSKNYAGLMPVAQRLVAASPDSAAAFAMLIAAGTRLRQWPQCEQAIADRLKRLPDDPVAIRLEMSVAQEKGDFEKVQTSGRELVALGKATAGDLNNLAWSFLFRGGVDAEALQMAQRSVLMTQSSQAAALHTLASLYAEAGKTTEARQVLLQAMDVKGVEEPEDEHWYVFGRIAEQFGVRQAAVTDYRKLKAPDPADASPTSTYVLAQARLKTLEETTGAIRTHN